MMVTRKVYKALGRNDFITSQVISCASWKSQVNDELFCWVKFMDDVTCCFMQSYESSVVVSDAPWCWLYDLELYVVDSKVMESN
jgi:hypothetical protein